MTEPRYPLMFRYKDSIAGDGFLAAVVVSGRALMMREDEQWWMCGVRPAAIADCGDTPPEAASRFRERYQTVLFDFAADSSNFEDFKKDVESFFGQEEPAITKDWNDAFGLIRSRQVEPEPPFSELAQAKPETQAPEIQVHLVELETLSSAHNKLDERRIAV